MQYHIIGLMSGSSLDGLDIAYVVFNINNKECSKIDFTLKHADCIPYDEFWLEKLKHAKHLTVPEYMELHSLYGRYLGQQVLNFIQNNGIDNKIDLIVSHGHTIYHSPSTHTSVQLGDGAQIASITQIPTLTDLRNIDVALGGQGAPIVPIADKMLFSEFRYCLNIGGIANITLNQELPIAFDLCPANQVLNHFASKLGHEFDPSGNFASEGQIDQNVLEQLLIDDFIQKDFPKSLDNSYSQTVVIPKLSSLQPRDALATSTAYIAKVIKLTLQKIHDPILNKEQTLLLTGGGAHNDFLVQSIRNELQELNISVVIPEKDIVDYKEAIAMALIGLLNLRNQNCVLHSVTGAKRDSIAGCLWKA